MKRVEVELMDFSAAFLLGKKMYTEKRSALFLCAPLSSQLFFSIAQDSVHICCFIFFSRFDQLVDADDKRAVTESNR